MTSTDMDKKKKVNRDTILKQFDEMINRSIGEGLNPYTANVVSFSGHGLHMDGDAIAVIPQTIGEDEGEARFINLSAYARKLAAQNNTLSVFICSMCRIELTPD